MNAVARITSAVFTASLDYASFTTAITNACKVVEKRNTIPILDTVHMRFTRGGVLITGTDLDIYTTSFVRGQVDQGFDCVVDAHKLLATMKRAKEASVINFALDGDRLMVTIGKLNLTLKHDLQITDFPKDMEFRTKLKQSNHSFVLPSAQLAKILEKVEFAISTEETRYYLNGVFMHVAERSRTDMLTFVTTDGHRLARYEIDVPAGAGGIPMVIIPRKTVTEVLRLVKRKGCPADTMITVTETGVSFLIGEDETIESKVIDGTFPDYTRVIPAQNSKKATAYISDLVDAIKQASSVTSERGRAVRLALSPGRLSLSCTDPDFGTAETSIRVDSNDEIEAGFNSGYMLDILAHIGGAAVFKFEDPGSPAIILDSSDAAVTYVQMPVRV